MFKTENCKSLEFRRPIECVPIWGSNFSSLQCVYFRPKSIEESVNSLILERIRKSLSDFKITAKNETKTIRIVVSLSMKIHSIHWTPSFAANS